MRARVDWRFWRRLQQDVARALPVCDKNQTGGAVVEAEKNLDQCLSKCGFVGDGARKVNLKEDICIAFAKVDSAVRPYDYGQRRRPILRPEYWRNTEHIRRGLDENVMPKTIASGVPGVPLVAHASTTSDASGGPPQSRRWFGDSGSCADISGEHTITSMNADFDAPQYSERSRLCLEALEGRIALPICHRAKAQNTPRKLEVAKGDDKSLQVEFGAGPSQVWRLHHRRSRYAWQLP